MTFADLKMPFVAIAADGSWTIPDLSKIPDKDPETGIPYKVGDIGYRFDVATVKKDPATGLLKLGEGFFLVEKLIEGKSNIGPFPVFKPDDDEELFISPIGVGGVRKKEFSVTGDPAELLRLVRAIAAKVGVA